MQQPESVDPGEILPFLSPDERLEVFSAATDAMVAVTDRRLLVAYDSSRVAFDAPFSDLRRIQLDIERGRPATMVIVPDRPMDPPQALVIPDANLVEAARAVAVVGLRLNGDPQGLSEP